MTKILRTRFILLSLLILSACDNSNVGPTVLTNDRWEEREKEQSIFGKGGLTFGGTDEEAPSQGGSGIGVNAYLWRATLDTVSFMPLASADPFGGVILTDWHSTVAAPNERYKLNVYILGQALRADGIRVAAFRQIKNSNGDWNAVNIDPKAVIDIENSILTRARQLRAESAPE